MDTKLLSKLCNESPEFKQGLENLIDSHLNILKTKVSVLESIRGTSSTVTEKPSKKFKIPKVLAIGNGETNSVSHTEAILSVLDSPKSVSEIRECLEKMNHVIKNNVLSTTLYDLVKRNKVKFTGLHGHKKYSL